MSRWRLFLCIGLLILGGAPAALTPYELNPLAWTPSKPIHPLVPLIDGLALGILAGAAFYGRKGADTAVRELGVLVFWWISYANVFFALMVVLARPETGATTFVLLTFAEVALAIALTMVERLRNNDPIELVSHWGGFGGSLGGWRASPLVALASVLLALILASALIAMPPRGGGQGGTPNDGKSTTAQKNRQ
jgi:hypothetical protein